MQYMNHIPGSPFGETMERVEEEYSARIQVEISDLVAQASGNFEHFDVMIGHITRCIDRGWSYQIILALLKNGGLGRLATSF